MSIQLMAQVWAKNLPQNEMLVLLALADHADDDGECFPSVRRLAWKTGYSERSVQRILKHLVEEQIIWVIEEASGRPGKPRVYKVTPGNAPPKAPFNTGDNLAPLNGRRVTPVSETGDKSSATGDIWSATGDTAMAPESSLEPSLESPYNRGASSKNRNPKGKTVIDEDGLEWTHDGLRWVLKASA